MTKIHKDLGGNIYTNRFTYYLQKIRAILDFYIHYEEILLMQF